VGWIAIPPAQGPSTPIRHRRDRGAFIGLVLVAIGVMIASDRLLPHGFRFGHLGAPLLLIGGGLAILFFRRRDVGDDDGPDGGSPVEPEPTSSAVPTAPRASEAAATGSVAGTEAEATTDTETETTTSAQPNETPDDATIVPPSAWTQTAPWPAPPSARSLRRASRRDRRDRRARPFLTPVTLSVLLIGAGIASLLQATGAADVNLTVLLAIGTGVVGAALITAAFVGRAHMLILVGIALLAATAISNTIDVPLRGGIGSRDYRPVRLSELRSHYELGIGELKLDLLDVPLSGRTTTIDAQTGVGHLVVFVPSSVRVEVHAHAGAGSARLFGRDAGGWPEDDARAVDGSGPGLLRLDLRVGAGQVEVRRFEPGGVETILGGN
jgi:predicted membrane protein